MKRIPQLELFDPAVAEVALDRPLVEGEAVDDPKADGKWRGPWCVGGEVRDMQSRSVPTNDGMEGN